MVRRLLQTGQDRDQPGASCSRRQRAAAGGTATTTSKINHDSARCAVRARCRPPGDGRDGRRDEMSARRERIGNADVGAHPLKMERREPGPSARPLGTQPPTLNRHTPAPRPRPRQRDNCTRTALGWRLPSCSPSGRPRHRAALLRQHVEREPPQEAARCSLLAALTPTPTTTSPRTRRRPRPCANLPAVDPQPPSCTDSAMLPQPLRLHSSPTASTCIRIASLLALAGVRIRVGEGPEPPLPPFALTPPACNSSLPAPAFTCHS